MTTEGRPRRTQRGLTPRQAFVGLAVLLGVILIGLVIYLFWFLGRPEVLTSRAPVEGVQPVWQVYGPGEGKKPRFSGPMGVAVGKGRIYVTDSGNHRVCAFDLQGRFVSEFGSFGIAKPAPGYTPTYVPGSLNYPVGIDTDDDGNVYVASFRNDSIEVFDADGESLRRFPDPNEPVGQGSSGTGGTGIAVTDVAVHGDRVYATDTYQVLVFTLDGEFVDQWGMPGTDPESLDHPNGIAVSDDGQTVYVSDSNHNRITAFSTDGDVRWQAGSIAEGVADNAPREIELPRGLTVMSDGSILVADAFAFGLVRIGKDGEFTAGYGERGVEPAQFNFPNDVDSIRGFVAVADKGNARLQMVRLTGVP